MTFKGKSPLFTLSMSALLMFALAGCSDDSSSEEETGTTEDTNTESTETTDTDASSTEYPIVIEHALGETTIEEKPERVAAIAWSNHDVPLALGVMPVGLSAANYGVQDDSGILPWTAEAIEELDGEEPVLFQDTDGIDFEAVADVNPDVILAAYSGLTQEEYDTLSQIAPVVAYQEAPWVSSWRDQVTYNSMAMGMAEEGEQLIADTEQLIADKVAEYPEFEGKTAAFLSVNAADLSSFFVYSPEDPRGAFLGEIGMEYPDSLLDEFTDPNAFYIEASTENADMLNDADVLVSYGDENTLEALQNDPILGQVPAIERGSVVIIGDNTPLAASGTPSTLSIEYTIDEYLTLMSEAVSKLEQ
ncbi:iron-siderophore ABC transporter substrate-binding protein [Jeotgalibacillus salarius]|uniref:Iron-siderophore ABC transporter substrate-binding protein n=1 Tax=Jeotgalibacillus salarius TaxID=546023 RepID=A0A4Y8LLB5_9BACL|nr:iron-siderophore ABC transporter substrate-binding protein [Jeotgalibacillus salarius]TFE01515.1 iron-siderophore ABC transporter substrate-binding protein [Jeotgalibacillus salarius]